MCPEPSLLSLPTACRGECKNLCRKRARLWVVAASEGIITILEKKDHGLAVPCGLDSDALFYSPDAFYRAIQDAAEAQQFDQLIVVGSQNDISWLRAALSNFTTRIIAEIDYALLPGDFQKTNAQQLSQRLLPLVS